MDEQKTTGGSDKTFTQADVDAIVDKRLAREREKYADYDAIKAKAAKFDEAEQAAKSELQKAQEAAAELQTKLSAREKELAAVKARGKVAAEMNVPEGLLTGETEEACKAQAEKLLAWRGGAPSMPNRSVDHMLGAKPGKTGTDTEAAYATLRDGLFPKN